MRRSRSFLIAFVAAIVELVIVAASGNQWVTNRVAENATGTALGNVLAHDAVGFPWRFNPQTDRERTWAAQLIGIGALIVLLFVFVLVLTARSSRSYWGNLIGIWGSTTLAGLLAAGLRQWIAFPTLYPNGHDAQGFGRWANAFVEGPSATAASFALASGLLTGLIAAAVGSLTSVPVEPEVAAPAAAATRAPSVWSPQTAAPWGEAPADEQPTTRWSDQPTDYRSEAYDKPTETDGDAERDRAPESSSAQPRRYAPEGGGGEYYSPRTSAEPAGDDYPQPGSTTELPTVPARERPRSESSPPGTDGSP